MKRAAAWLGWILLALAAGAWACLRAGVLLHDPALLAALAGAALAAFLARAVQLAVRVVRGATPRRIAGAELLLVAGVAVSLASGGLNWLFGLQGAVILIEGEQVKLSEGAQLQQFEAGPLARIDEMALQMRLERVELIPAGADGFLPLSHLGFQRAGERPQLLSVTSQKKATVGTLRVFQGAFGFAPRLVLVREGKTVFDQVVPFTSRLSGPGGAVAFEGEARVESLGVALAGRVSLESLDEGMRGHPTLELTMRGKEKELGRGTLLPGQFADLPQGWRVGFAGLKMWSEVDIIRRTYSPFVLAGGAVALAGLLALALAHLISRRRSP